METFPLVPTGDNLHVHVCPFFPGYFRRTRMQAAFKSIHVNTCIRFKQSNLALSSTSRTPKFAVVFSNTGSR